MTRILILEDSKDCLNAVTVMVEKVSGHVCAVPVNSLEEARAALNDGTQPPFQAFLLERCRTETSPYRHTHPHGYDRW